MQYFKIWLDSNKKATSNFTRSIFTEYIVAW